MSVGVQIQINDTGVLAALNRLMLEGSEKRDLLDMIGIGEAENTRMRFIDQEGARLSADLAREHWLSSPTLRADSGFGNSSDSKTAWQNRSEPSSTLMPM